MSERQTGKLSTATGERPSASGKLPTNRVHGSIIGARLAYAEQQWGKRAREIIIDKLPPKEKGMAESVVFENMWFDLPILELIERAIVENFAAGDAEIYRKLGRFSAEYNHKRLPSQLIGLQPEEIFKNISRINIIFLQEFGEFRSEMLEGDEDFQGAALVYHYNVEVSASYCASALGYFERLLELNGYHVIKAEETLCQTRGDDLHRYEFWWDTKPVSDAVVPTKTTGKFPAITGRFPAATAGKPARAAKTTAALAEEDSFSPSPLFRKLVGDDKDVNWLNWRVKVLVISIMVVSLFGVCEGLYVLLTRHKDPVTKDKIHPYTCTGEFKPEVRLDKPFLLVKTKEYWKNVKISTWDGNKKYTYSAKQFIQNANIELSLGEFISPDFKNLDPEILPSTLSITAIVDDKPKACSCQYGQ